MPEPTIDEMLEWLDQWEGDNGRVAAIRAILEQHRHYSQVNTDLVVIRAFVERVEELWNGALKAYEPDDPERWTYRDCVQNELAAMEKDAE